jgi:hypothetical protein
MGGSDTLTQAPSNNGFITGDELHEASRLAKWQRSLQFWRRATRIYASFKVPFLMSWQYATLQASVKDTGGRCLIHQSPWAARRLHR